MAVYLAYAALVVATVVLCAVMRKRGAAARHVALAGSLPAAAMVLLLWRFSEPAAQNLFIDFYKAYYPAACALLDNPADLSELYKQVDYVNIPIVALAFVPFALLGHDTAVIAYTFVSLIPLVVAIYLLIRMAALTGWQRLVLIGLFVANGPLFYSLRLGNNTHMVFLLLVAALLCQEKGREWEAGALLALAAWIKIPLALFGAYYLLRRRWRTLIGFGSALVAVALISVALYGFGVHEVWFKKCIRPFLGHPLAAFNVQSVDGFVARLMTDGNLENWRPLLLLGWEYKLLRSMLLLILMGGTVWVLWRRRARYSRVTESLEFSIVLCLAIITSPISWTHYYMFLLLPVALYCGRFDAVSGGWLRGLFLTGVALISLPVILPQPASPFLSWLADKVWLSHYFYGGVMMLGVLLAIRWRWDTISEENRGLRHE